MYFFGEEEVIVVFILRKVWKKYVELVRYFQKYYMYEYLCMILSWLNYIILNLISYVFLKRENI